MPVAAVVAPGVRILVMIFPSCFRNGRDNDPEKCKLAHPRKGKGGQRPGHSCWRVSPEFNGIICTCHRLQA